METKRRKGMGKMSDWEKRKREEEKIRESLKEGFLEDTAKKISLIEKHLVEYPESIQKIVLLEKIRLGFHSLKGASALLRFTDIFEHARSMEAVAKSLISENRELSGEYLEDCKTAVKEIKEIVSKKLDDIRSEKKKI